MGRRLKDYYGKGKRVQTENSRTLVFVSSNSIHEKIGKSRNELKRTALKRVAWRQLVGGLCPRRGKRP